MIKIWIQHMLTFSGKPIEWDQGEENTSLRCVFSEPSSCPAVLEGEITEKEMWEEWNINSASP